MYELELKNVYMFEMNGTGMIIVGDGSTSEPRPRKRDSLHRSKTSILKL